MPAPFDSGRSARKLHAAPAG